jgi:hypothetical protein
MKLSGLLRQLSFVELANLSLSGEGSGTIVSGKVPQMVAHVNEGLLRLHERFQLRENFLILELVGHITDYRLEAPYALSNETSTVPHRYIIDYETPFEDDVIRVTSVKDGWGRDFPLNDEFACGSLFTPQPTVLQVPTPVTGVPISVTYQASHKVLGETDLDQQFSIPKVLEGALRAYVAYLVFTSIGNSDAKDKALANQAKYEEICARVEQDNSLGTSPTSSSSQFERNGWI